MTEERPRRALRSADSVDEGGRVADKGGTRRERLAVSLGNRIQRCRVARNITSEALAEAAGVSRQRLSVWENGKGMPDVFSLHQVARVLNVSLDWLVCGPAQIISLDSGEIPALVAAPVTERLPAPEAATAYRGAAAYISTANASTPSGAEVYVRAADDKQQPTATADIVALPDRIQEQMDDFRCRLEELERKQR
jgi:transcriptional regulator with XRE-family HTH domain